ncbi:MAG: hypothetical protein SP1CHLAM54_14650 [Chlamydiia bacterium]|nr:hypothetical protein [Chlamydiia bacterium]MCH9616355.1 hypothetical protein [Chlamydiia bacterium]MCH9629659.1 hypothetical protein [Chlamydiia bacterium]
MKKGASLFSIFFTFAVDNLGATIVFPIFAPLFLDPHYGMVGHNVISHTTMLGIFLAAFPLMQLFFAPILGDYADHKGRRNALLLTTCVTVISYVLSAIAISRHMLGLLFFARLLMGAGSGNLSICLSALSDLSESSKKRVKYFSLGSAIAGLTFVLGPFVGGKLADPSIFSYFSIASPMWLGAFLSFINLLFLFFWFDETLKVPSTAKFDLLKGLHNLRFAWKLVKVRNLYVVYFFYLFAWNIFFQFIPAYSVEMFNLSPANIGDLCALMGLCWVFGSGVLNNLFHDMANPKWVLCIAFLLFAGATYFIGFPKHITHFVVITGIATIISGVIWPLCTSSLSNAAEGNIQGKVMGLSQSVLSLAMILAAVTGGFFLQFHLTVPFIMAAVATVFSSLWILKN